MSFDRLHPEIWAYLLTFLAVPLPKPLSGVVKEEAIGEDPGAISRLPSAGDAGTTSRKDIRADALAKLMRTSIAFNQLASGPLYKRVITDALPTLTSHLDTPPAHPRTQSKLQLLKRIRYLHLEYRSKTQSPTYLEIMRDRRHLPSIGVPVDEATLMCRAEIEAEHIYDCISALAERKKDDPVFDSLITLSTSAIFGPQRGVWERAMMLDPLAPLGRKIQWSAMMMEPAFRSSSLVEWCTRSGYGPYTISVFKWDHPSLSGTPKPLLAAHVDEQTSLIPVSNGGRTRWILENYIHGEFMISVCPLILHWVATCQMLARSGRLPASRLSIEIYASGGRTKPDETEYRKQDVRILTVGQEKAELARIMGLNSDGYVRDGDRPASQLDAYRFKSLPDARPCLGCGWHFEPMEPQGVDDWLKGGGDWMDEWEAPQLVK